MKKNSTEIRGLLIRRGLSSVLALVLGLCVLTGCGGSSSEGGAHGSSSKQLSYEDAETLTLRSPRLPNSPGNSLTIGSTSSPGDSMIQAP